MISDPVLSVADAVAVLNQTLEMVYPTITVVGELANFKVARGKWVYTDIKDESARLSCFGTVFQLPGPLEEGIKVEIIAEPRIHPQFGFKLNIKQIKPVGEGSIKKAADLLKVKLQKEGLFDESRKRALPYPPQRIGLIASVQSAAYGDFIKILNARWQGITVDVYDVQVQGQNAAEDIITAINYFNQNVLTPDVLVITRGGGSADDLAAFSTEQVIRTIASSRVPTLVAVGHEMDISLADLVSDRRASTPSNAAELISPSKEEVKKQLGLKLINLNEFTVKLIKFKEYAIKEKAQEMRHTITNKLEQKLQNLKHSRDLLLSIHPSAVLKKGYALIQAKGKLISSIKDLNVGQKITLTLDDGSAQSVIEKVQ